MRNKKTRKSSRKSAGSSSYAPPEFLTNKDHYEQVYDLAMRHLTKGFGLDKKTAKKYACKSVEIAKEADKMTEAMFKGVVKKVNRK